MYRLIPAILVVAAAFLVQSPANADELEAGALMATLDCAIEHEDTYLADREYALGCHVDALDTLSYLSPDVSTGCVSMWNALFAFHAIAAAGYTYSFDSDTVSPLDALDFDFELVVAACLAS